MEIWRQIESTDYEVSDRGRVRRGLHLQKFPGRILKASRHNNYPAVCLVVDGVEQTRSVHRLVCAAFHGPAPSPQHHAAHNDGDTMNAAASNLRWATPGENSRDKWSHGTAQIGEKHGRASLSDQEARSLRAEYAAHIATRPHSRVAPGWMKALASRVGLPFHTVRKIVKGRGYPAGDAASAPAPGREKGAERRVASPLSFQQVQDLRRRRAAGEPLKALAKEYGIHPASASKIAAVKSRAAA